MPLLRAFAALCVPLLLFACPGEAPPTAAHCTGVLLDLATLDPPTLDLDLAEISSTHLLKWIKILATPELRGRHATSDEANAVAALIAGHMSTLGLVAPFQGPSYCQAFPLQGERRFNVVGHLPREEETTGGAILLGAHYDGQGMHPAGLVYPSADDNASGVAALLEIARLATHRSWPFDLVFVALTAEEIGQVGSLAWLAEPTVNLADLRLMVNFDMVGHPWPGAPPEAIGYGAWNHQVAGAQAPNLKHQLDAAAAASEIGIRQLKELFSDDQLRSDSTIFRQHVPTLFISTGLHEDYHQRTDTADRVDPDQVARAARLIFTLLEQSAE